MPKIHVGDQVALDCGPFADLIGADFMTYIAENAPRKVMSRVGKALDHLIKARRLVDIDEEMGAIRLVAGEEELVVAIFEWLKLRPNDFPEHREFVRRFKNHIVKISFYPVLQQFKWILSDQLQGFTLEGMEGLIDWRGAPVIEGKAIRLLISDQHGKEIFRHDPLSIDITSAREQASGMKIVPLLVETMRRRVRDQRGQELKQFLEARADYRNQFLYATDAGFASMEDSLESLLKTFEETYHDLLWVLLLLIGGKPPSKSWGIVSQFIGVYRQILVEAKVVSKRTDANDSFFSRLLGALRRRR